MENSEAIILTSLFKIGDKIRNWSERRLLIQFPNIGIQLKIHIPFQVGNKSFLACKSTFQNLLFKVILSDNQLLEEMWKHESSLASLLSFFSGEMAIHDLISYD